MRRPAIGISGPDRGGLAAWLFASWAVRRAGGRPVRITPKRGLPTIPLDGLVVGGGADVAPLHYSRADAPPPMRQELQTQRGSRSKLRVVASYVLAPLVFVLRRLSSARAGTDPARDALEISLIREAVQRGSPILGICRGAQLLNVCFGGTLHRDLSDFYVERANPWTIFPRKPVDVAPESRLHAALATTRCTVNSLHRQAVDALGAGIRASARELNGVVQAVEHVAHPFMLGVQWHPEYLPQRPEQRRLFRALVAAAVQLRAGAGLDATLRSSQELLRELAVTKKDGEGVHQAQDR